MKRTKRTATMIKRTSNRRRRNCRSSSNRATEPTCEPPLEGRPEVSAAREDSGESIESPALLYELQVQGFERHLHVLEGSDSKAPGDQLPEEGRPLFVPAVQLHRDPVPLGSLDGLDARGGPQ